MPGCSRQMAWWREKFDAGSLGIYNPASLGGRSLHAEGRAMDIALNAHDPHERNLGDAIFDLVMAHPDWFGAQEMLWRGFLWSWVNRHLGKRGPGIQQRDHENHVHLGIDVHAARFWTPDWVPGGGGDEMALSHEDTIARAQDGFKRALSEPEGRRLVIDCVDDALGTQQAQMFLVAAIELAFKGKPVRAAIREVVDEVLAER